MTRRMLIDASAPGEIRVAVVENNQLIDYDFESSAHKQWKSSIFLAQVTRVEPSLQAAFLEYGALRQGFLALPEIHPDYYRIPIADREQLNAALKQSAAEARAEAEADDENGDGGDSETAADGGLELLSGFTKLDLIDALLEAKGLGGTRDDVEPVLHNTKWLTDALDDIANGGDELAEEDAASEDNQTGGRRNFRGRGRHGGSRFRRRELDPEQAEAQRRRNLLRSYKIQEVIKRRQVMLVQVNKEERGTKGAALTSYISLPGRYCVLMPNSPTAGGVSRKITNPAERKRMKDVLSQLTLPEGMGVILRTAGLERPLEDIARDLDYLVRLWGNIRELTLKSTAPALVYEEGDLITRAIRDLYSDDIAEILVSGDAVYDKARNFMEMLLPAHVGNIKKYDGKVPLFTKFNVDEQIDAVHTPNVQLPSGGYIVINQTEALVAIDVNSGRATRERNIEETAYRTNLEAATEIARQVRLRDLAGLIVVDFIDMEDARHRIGVERRMRDAMKSDRARVQIGRISSFGLLEMSRQRLRPSVVEAHFTRCEACGGSGWARSTASSARHLLRAIETEALKSREQITVHAHSKVALYALNQLRAQVTDLEERSGIKILIEADDSLTPPDYRLERAGRAGAAQQNPRYFEQAEAADVIRPEDTASASDADTAHLYQAMPRETSYNNNAERADNSRGEGRPEGQGRGRRFRGRGRGNPNADLANGEQPTVGMDDMAGNDIPGLAAAPYSETAAPRRDFQPRPRRDDSQTGDVPAADGQSAGTGTPGGNPAGGRSRGRRGGRGRNRNYDNNGAAPAVDVGAEQPSVDIAAFAPRDGYYASGSAPTYDTVPLAGPEPLAHETAGYASAIAAGDMPAQQPPANGNRDMQQPPAQTPLAAATNITPVSVTPMVTRVSADGIAQETDADGTPRKGWWKKLMES